MDGKASVEVNAVEDGDGKGQKRSASDLEQENAPTKRKRVVELAKSRMSKWAARLFDPDRPRGVVEPPQVIPLNDEFLIAFGRREKKHDEAMGKVTLAVDNDLASDDEDSLYSDTKTEKQEGESKKTGAHRIKVDNLKYTTTVEALEKACEAFGTVSKVNMIMEDKNESNSNSTPMNTGRAYVTFETAEAAQACMEKLDSLDGRPLRIEVVGNPNPNSAAAATSRYFVGRDISKKCFRCGQPGHMEAECSNAPLLKPCPLCAYTDHDLRSCPIKAVCFNCGIPGHVSKNCNQRRGMPPRAICSICYGVGHTKYQCLPDFTTAQVAAQYAICMVCGETGHLSCREMRWSGSIQGVYCWNCGEAGHIGKQCRRPGLEECSRDEELARREIQSAEFAISSPPPRPPVSARGRQMADGHGDDNRRRAKSAPPRRDTILRHNSMPSRYDAMPPRHDRHQQPLHRSQSNQYDPLPARNSRHFQREPPHHQNSDNNRDSRRQWRR